MQPWFLFQAVAKMSRVNTGDRGINIYNNVAVLLCRFTTRTAASHSLYSWDDRNVMNLIVHDNTVITCLHMP